MMEHSMNQYTIFETKTSLMVQYLKNHYDQKLIKEEDV